MEVYENGTGHLSNNLRLKEISKLIFFQFNCNINRNQLEIIMKTTYGLHPNKYFDILNPTFGKEAWWRGVSDFIQIPEAWMRSKACQFNIDFRNRNLELLLLFSIYLHDLSHVLIMFKHFPN